MKQEQPIEFILQNMKCAVFDMDGTILDSMPMWTRVGNIFLREHGLSEDDTLWHKMKPLTLFQCAEYIQSHYALDVSCNSVEQIYSALNAITFREYSTRLELKDGAREMLSELKKRAIPAVLATATDRSCVDACLARLNIAEDFAFVLTCRELDTSKAEPLIFEESCRRCGVPKSETVVFEDALHAIRTARGGGFSVIAIEDSVAHEKSLETTAPSDWDEIQKIASASVSSWREVLAALP